LSFLQVARLYYRRYDSPKIQSRGLKLDFMAYGACHLAPKPLKRTGLMNWSDRKCALLPEKLGLVIAAFGVAFLCPGEVRAQSSFAANAQHTANYSTPAQNLNAVHWTTSIDMNNTGGFAHYGSPVLTPANTIFVPVKTGVTSGFAVNAFNAATGVALYSPQLTTDYIAPSSEWIAPYQPVLATNSVETRLYYPGAGGSIYYIDNVDSPNHGVPVQQFFYTTLANYQANASAFNSTVFIDTPITADSAGDIFFGFRVQGTAPAPLNTTQSGYARIDPSGNATYVLAGAAASDANIAFDSHSAAPALSNDQSTVYVVVKSASADSSYGYLLGLNATTLATKYKVFLYDPRGNNANPATILDISTASPMVGPDNDVYFGIYGNPANGSRGFLLHFSSDLTVEKPVGGFGWDYTPGVVPATMVPSYTGSSSYLLLTKYNNYANAGTDSADGVNRVALLDPNSTEVDAHASSNGMLIMREVLTVIGPTADYENRSSSLPYAVREWCINTPGVNPSTNSVFFPSEDGNLYRWNLVTDSLDEFVTLNAGLGEPYVPTIVGPDGTVFTLNGGGFSAVGSVNGVGIALTSSMPDVRTTVAGQPLTFSVAVTNTGNSGVTPTGTVTVQDTVYFVVSGTLEHTTTTLASNLALNNGEVSFTTSALTADKHFITANYSGDSNFSTGSSSLIQIVHSSASSTTLSSSANPATPGQQITLTATVAAVPSGSSIPTGQVTFLDGKTVIGQVPLNTSGTASFSTSNLSTGSHNLSAVYASDTLFAASTGTLTQSIQTTISTTTFLSSSANPSVYGQSVTFTATVTPASGSSVPTGTVTFKNGATTLGTGTLNASGVATFMTSTLAVGSYSITAVYGGSASFQGSASAVLTQTVNQDGTTSTLTSSQNPSKRGKAVKFTATVTAKAPGTGTPTGAVTFKDGSTTLGTSSLTSGKATFTTSTLSIGTHTITAAYGGSTDFATSTSAPLAQTVK
jgi:hypothetical protein